MTNSFRKEKNDIAKMVLVGQIKKDSPWLLIDAVAEALLELSVKEKREKKK